MNSIESFPADDWPEREKLPKFSDQTGDALISWAMGQPGSLGWVLKRSSLLWEMFPGQGDDHIWRVEACAALDLLRHRIAAPDDRSAVEHLNADLWKTNNQKDT